MQFLDRESKAQETPLFRSSIVEFLLFYRLTDRSNSGFVLTESFSSSRGP